MATVPWYCTREDVLAAGDVRTTAWRHAQVDRLIAAASRSIDEQMRRVFYPTAATRYFPWPADNTLRGWVLWLEDSEAISVSALSSGGTAIDSDDYFLEPVNEGPPYSRIEIDRASTVHFGHGDTPQREVTVTGVFGHRDDHVPAGALAEALDTSETGVDVTNSAAAGVGSLLRVGTERMIVTGKSMLSTGQTLQTPLTALASNETVAVTSGSTFGVEETILLDAERMRIVDIAGDNLIVKRAHDGSTLAAHTGSTIYAPRALTVERGALGSTAAEHDTAAAVSRHAVPSLITQLCVAEALVALMQETTAYGRTVGSGDNAREAAGLQLADLRELAYRAHARKVV